MRITCITPTCEGREPFLKLCRKYVERFTLQPEEHLVQTGPFLENLDKLLSRVRTELVAFIEDDDWYHPRYLADMVSRLEYSKRAMIGYDPTLYYHVVRRGYMTLPHRGRASLYATVGIASVIESAYARLREKGGRISVDQSLWQMLAQTSVTTVGQLAVGMKHGLTRTEGNGHYAPQEAWTKDHDMEYLKKIIGKEDAETYAELIDGLTGGTAVPQGI